jgi:hypothetical protein
MILTVHAVAQVIMRRDRHSLSLHYSFFIVKTVPTNVTINLTAHNISVTIAYVCSSSLRIQLSEPLKLVTSILVGDNVTNASFLLFFFFNMRLPYVFHFTYPDTSLPAGVHESPNTCTTCVCLTVNTPFPTV